MPCHTGNGKTILSSIKESLDYGKNPDKTRNGEFISSCKCNPLTADVVTYEDKKHIHSHIYFNSTTLDCTKKFKNFWDSARAVRKLSDQICIENGLSIIENPKENKIHYGKWLGNKKKLTNRDILRQDIDSVLARKPKDFDDFLSLMKDLGYEVKQGKNLTFKSLKFERAVHCNSLKGNYTEEILRKRIEKNLKLREKNTTNKVKYEPPKTNLLVDIENNIKAKNLPGYERWAKVFNLKQAAQTLIYLQENNIDEYDKLKNLVSAKNNLQNGLTARIKTIEKRFNEIKDLEKHKRKSKKSMHKVKYRPFAFLSRR